MNTRDNSISALIRHDLDMIFHAIPHMMCIVDKNYDILQINAALSDKLDLKQDQSSALKCYRVFQTNRCKTPGCILDQTLEQQSRINSDYDLKIGGIPYHCNVCASPVTDGTGDIIAVVLAILDISRLKEAELQLQSNHQQLIHASKMVALGTLVSGVAHEINNPNNFIMLNAPLLKEAWDSVLPILDKYYDLQGDFDMGGLPYSEMRDHIPKLFSGILEGADRIKTIVKDLKGFSRPDTSDMNQSVDIREVIESARVLLSHQIKRTTDDFSIRYQPGLPNIRGNPQRMEQVIINMIQNACQAIADKEQAIRIDVSHDQVKHEIRIEIRDEGVGIPRHILPYIMDPFFSSRRNSGGTGLGLSISAKIIRDHGGIITVSSESGKGTTFIIHLPEEQKTNKKVLIADDDPEVVQILSDVMQKRYGYAVEKASDGIDACIKIGSFRPDLLLLDIHMPHMDGLQVCGKIKQQQELVHMKTIIITGYPDSLEMEKIIDMGFEFVFKKSSDLKELISLIDTVMTQC